MTRGYYPKPLSWLLRQVQVVMETFDTLRLAADRSSVLRLAAALLASWQSHASSGGVADGHVSTLRGEDALACLPYCLPR